jgi:hypothetical protein
LNALLNQEIRPAGANLNIAGTLDRATIQMGCNQNSLSKSNAGVHGFKVPFSFLSCISERYLREKQQLRQAEFIFWSQIGNYLGK